MRLLFILLLSSHLYGTPITHKVLLAKMEFAKPAKQIPFTGYYRLKKQGAVFLHDLGSKEILENEYGYKGFYLPFSSVRQNMGKVFGKWRETLKQPKHSKLLELFEGNLASSNLRELFSFPAEVHFQKNAKNKTVLLFLDYTIPLSMQMREILNFSLRGYNVLAVDFYHYNKGKSFICWGKCKKIAELAFKSIDGEIILYGKSFGSAAATFLAAKNPSCLLILDRPFTCMKEAVGSFLLDHFISIHYSYPTNKYIKKLKKAPLIISCSGSNVFKTHAEKLLKDYSNSQKNSSHANIRDKCFISTKGGHYSSLLNNGKSSWFSYEKAQRKLTRYLYSLDNH